MKTKQHQYKVTKGALDSVKRQAGTGDFMLDSRTKGKNLNAYVILIEDKNGEATYYEMVVKRMGKNVFGGIIPEPDNLFFFQALEYEAQAEAVAGAFKDNIINTLMSEGGKTAINVISQPAYNLFISYKISCIIALVMAVESVINRVIPVNYSSQGNDGQTYDRETIEKRWQLKQKLNDIIPSINTIADIDDYNHKRNKFLTLCELRNELVHLKHGSQRTPDSHFMDYMITIINLNLKEKIEDTKELIKYIDPISQNSMGSVTYDFLADSILFNDYEIEHQYSSLNDSQLEHILQEYRAHCLENMGDLQNEVKSNQSPLKVLSNIENVPLDTIKQGALYFDQFVIYDPLFELTYIQGEDARVTSQYLGYQQNDFDRRKLVKCVQFLKSITPMVAADYIKMLPLSVEFEPPQATPFNLPINYYADSLQS